MEEVISNENKKHSITASAVVDTRGGENKTRSLWNGAFMETVNQDGLVEYEYDVLHTVTRLRPNLAEIIENNFDVWYNSAKNHRRNTYRTETDA